MRIGIRLQLGLVVLGASLVPLIVLALATWFNNYNFTINVKEHSLRLTASLKAASIASDLRLIQATCSTIVTRILIQQAIRDFYQGQPNWGDAREDVASALASRGVSSLLQVIIFSRNETGSVNGILNITSNASAVAGIQLPYNNSNNQPAFLGDADQGYPPTLYPNISYVQTTTPDPNAPGTNFTRVSAFADYPLNQTAALLLGPLQINSSYALVSLTLPIIDNSNSGYVLGYMTVVAAATSLIDAVYSREGLEETGIVLVVGTNRRENQFSYGVRPATADYKPDLHNLKRATVKYIFPPYPLPGQTDRHSVYNSNVTKFGSSNFTEGQYPGIFHGFGEQISRINNASSYITTTNEQGVKVAVGWARPQSELVDWLVIVEQAHSEAWEPILKLRNILLACVFGTFGLILIVVVPMAHFSVRPIRRLRDATKHSIQPPGYTPRASMDDQPYGDEEVGEGISNGSKKMGFFVRLRKLTHSGGFISKAEKSEKSEADRRRGFNIPGKVPDRKHWVHDELTDLTSKFNEMSDELLLQYTSLESKVAERTVELEHSKKAAEAANESKTLFIANISHELKTPLNGILGMCAVCMGEDDLPSIKRSLSTVYKSGDLLLNLLNDLLTFSKNQIGQQLNLEEKEFRLSDIKEQIRNIFRKQVDEGGIDFGVHFLGTESTDGAAMEKPTGKPLPALGPNGIGRLKDMCLWGDQHRILQIIINLVSNSLKFTPPGGKVEVRIRCIGETESSSDGANSRNSMGSKQSSQRRNVRNRNGSASNASGHTSANVSGQISRRESGAKPSGTALVINPMDPRARLQLNERSATPPPHNSRTLWFSIEVEDTGPGIPEHLQERVFEPFVQADLGLNKKYGGTGLGLSICSQLAGLMGGSISLVSTPGEGSTFNVQLPLKFVKERAQSTSSSDINRSRPASMVSQTELDRHTPKGSIDATTAVGSPGKGYSIDTQPRLVGLRQPFFTSSPTPPPNEENAKTQLAALDRAAKEKLGDKKIRVLVAEDNLVNQEVVLRMLKLEDVYDVVIAKDGQEAYDMVKQSMEEGKFFNLIFMDIQMPNLDGLQSTRLIREMGYSAPIVALTAFAEESNVKECYESGMDHFLSKPIRRPALKQVLRKFATIPEETEDSSLTRKSTPEKGEASKQKHTKPTSSPTTTIPPSSSDSDTNVVKPNGTPSPP
ncbi:Histidine kinase osmosensor [Ciborinia camelliae]|nr:Histidine kinase osmosensor [Ciborinia camelliae]